VLLSCRATAGSGDLATSGPHDARRPINSAPRKDRRRTQRERIIAGLIDAVAREGYAAATVAQVIKTAGVSRPTFYEYFTNKDAALVAALQAIAAQLSGDVARALDGASADRAMHSLADALLEFAAGSPSSARVLLEDALRGGPAALDARDRAIETLATLVDTRRGARSSDGAPDVAARAWIGGICRILAARLRAGQAPGRELLKELHAWIDDHALALREHRWRDLPGLSLPAAPDTGQQRPQPAPSRVTGLPRPAVAESQRQRILQAAAQLAERKGYQATTVADITKLARVDNRAFYKVFTDKQQAFGALHEQLFGEFIAVAATGFLSGASWPERVWEAARALTGDMQQRPTMAYAALVDSHSGSAAMVERVRELVSGFTIFLQEGYQHTRRASAPSPFAVEATAATVFELYYLQLRESRDRLLGIVPHVTFVAVSPFIGVAAANELIDRKLQGLLAPHRGRSPRSKSPRRFTRGGATSEQP
jgi:AcrR family transcriptional regulator